MNPKYAHATALFGLAFSLLFSSARPSSPTMIGSNISGGEFGTALSQPYPGNIGTQYWYPRPDDIDMVKNKGMELVRVPIWWDRIQHENNGVLDATLWEPDMIALTNSINAMEARGMRIILELHNFMGRRLTIDGTRASYRVGSPELPVSELCRLWRMLADRFKDRPSIWGYDIMNEPLGVTTAQIVAISQEVVNAIREVDMRTAIILEGGPNWNHASSWLTTGAPLIAVVDPANNLIFSAHCYTDRDQSGTWTHGATLVGELVGAGKPYPDVASALNVGVDRIRPFVDWCVANNVRGLVGEYATPQKTDEANWNIVTQRMLDYMVNNGNGLISGTQWSSGAIDVRSETRMAARGDNSMPSFQSQHLPNYVSGVGTNYWQPFVWYDESLIVTADYAFPYSFQSTTPSATCTFNISDTSVAHSGTRSAALSYTIPAGGFAGAGFHVRGPIPGLVTGGVDISRSIIAGHVLSFWARGTAGATPSITLGTTSNASGLDSGSDTGTGNWVNIASIAPLTNTWQRYEIPLSSFLNAQITGAQRIQRIRINAGPANGVAYQVNFDRIMIGLPSTNVAPSVTVGTAGGGTTFSAGQSFTLVATATDANPGDSIDYVEFYADSEKVGIDDTAPYQCTTSLAEPGMHSVKAIAFDSHGVVGQSAPLSLTITGAPAVPSGVTAVPGNSRVLLNWAGSSGATSYNVKRAVVSGGPYATVGSPTTNSFIDTGRSNNTTYYYVVSAVSGSESANSAQVSATPQAITIIRDNPVSPSVPAGWTQSSSNPGAYGGSYLHDGNTGTTNLKSIVYTPGITVAGNYQVYARWTASPNRAENTPVDVNHAGGTNTFALNQRLNNNTWMLLGTFFFNAGTSGNVTIRNQDANGYVIADAVRFVLD
jgi:hypothetical protein